MREHLERMSDDEVMSSLESLVRSEREDLVRILRRLAELDQRRAACKKGFPSLFIYCTRVLGYSEGEAMRRIQTARAGIRFPVVYRLVGRGLLSIAAVAVLEPHLTKRTYRALLKRAIGMSGREVRALADSLVPMKKPADRVRVITVAPSESQALAKRAAGQDLFAQAFPACEAGSGDPPAPIPPPGPALEPRAQFSFTADPALLREVERARELLRHKFPFARLEDVFGEAVRVLLERIDPERAPARRAARRPSRPADPRSRRIPPSVKDAVWKRDGGACAYEAEAGRCGARAFLEFDHVVPWARGGRSDDPANIRLLCRQHNQVEARRAFGDAAVDEAAGLGAQSAPRLL
ncbi:HNH endonuclease [bacterium]|nr:MAG: HNH endonuclease [bacterium]